VSATPDDPPGTPPAPTSAGRSRTPRPAPKQDDPGGLRGAIVRFRVMAYLVGVGLLVLVFVGIPLQIWADSPGVVHVVGPIHGFLYLLYLVAGADLARRAGWPVWRLWDVVVAGLIPFAAFVVERRVVHRAERQLARPTS
jgi:integral membrane protein